MVKQYPYTLKVLQESESFFNQEKAEWEKGNSHWADWGGCRDEINGSGGKIKTEDSENYTFSAVVYAPRTINEINKGARIQVWNGEELRLEGVVVRFGKEQLHTRIWL